MRFFIFFFMVVLLVSLFVLTHLTRRMHAHLERDIAQASIREKPEVLPRKAVRVSEVPEVWQVIGKDGKVDIETQSLFFAKRVAKALDEVDPIPVPKKPEEQRRQVHVIGGPVPAVESKLMRDIEKKKPGFQIDAARIRADYKQIIRDHERAAGFFTKNVHNTHCMNCNRIVNESHHASYKTMSGSGTVRVYCIDE